MIRRGESVCTCACVAIIYHIIWRPTSWADDDVCVWVGMWDECIALLDHFFPVPPRWGPRLLQLQICIINKMRE